MQINQKRFSNKHKFTFNEKYLNFFYENRTGSDEVDIAYGDFSKKRSIRIEENTWLRNVGVLWAAIGIAGLIFKFGGEMWLPIGVICIIWSQLSKVKYTVMTAERGSIWIIQDKKHDEILQEIYERRKNQILSWYGEINYENDPQSEIRKFQWLFDEGVMSKEQAEMKIAEIKMNAQAPSLKPPAGMLLN